MGYKLVNPSRKPREWVTLYKPTRKPGEWVTLYKPMGQIDPQVAYKHTKTTKDFFSKCFMIGSKVLHSSNKQ